MRYGGGFEFVVGHFCTFFTFLATHNRGMCTFTTLDDAFILNR